MAEAPSRPEKPIRLRLFIGGCSRSGTTFLQRFLAGHSRVHTFPETGVFLRALGMRGRVLPWARIGLTLGKERKSLQRLLETVGGGEDVGGRNGPSVPPRRLFLKDSVRDIVAFLDALAQGKDRDVWVEKTPRHVLHATRIQTLVPSSRFLHMVRDGRDVVASIVDRARKFPDRFGRQADPAYGIAQWNRSMRATEAAMRRPGHHVIHYHALASRPRESLEALCASIGIDFEEEMLQEQDGSNFILQDEAWKKRLTGPIQPSASKFKNLFDERTRYRINEGLDQGFFREIEMRVQGNAGGIWSS